jgi:hypothetical protein
MKRLIWFTLLFCSLLSSAEARRRWIPKAPSGGGGGTPAFVEFQASAGSNSNVPQTIAITVASGNSICVCAKWEDATATVSVADTALNAYTGGTMQNYGGLIWGRQFYAINVTGGALTITVTYTGTGVTFVRAGAIEMSGVTAFDQEATPGTGNVGSAGSPAVTGNITTPNAVQLLVCNVNNYGGVACAPQTSWTEVYDPNALEIQYFVTSSTGSYHGEGTLASSSEYCVFMMAFK